MIADVADTGVLLPAVAECPLSACIAGARMGGDGSTRYFAFRCVFGGLSPWTSYKRYSECLKLSESIKTNPRAPNFPSKSWGLSRLLADEEELALQEEQRQQSLQSWFDYYLEHRTSLGDYEKFLLFFEVGRQQKLQGGEGGGEARAGVAPDVTLHEGALRTDATFIARDGTSATAHSEVVSDQVQQSDVSRDRSASYASLEGKSEGVDRATGERDGGGAGVNDTDDFTTEGGGSSMATPEKQRLCEEDDPDISNLMLQTPDSSEKKQGDGDVFDAIPGSISLFQGQGGGAVERSSIGVAAVSALDDSSRFNSGMSISTNSSHIARPRTPPHVRGGFARAA